MICNKFLRKLNEKIYRTEKNVFMVKILSKSLEDLEKELTEVEPEVEGEPVSRKKLITAIIFGYLFWLASYMLIYIYNNPGAYSSVSDISNILIESMISIPALGYSMINEFLSGGYVLGAELALPAMIAGIVSGLVARKLTNGILVGAVIWFIGLVIGALLLSYSAGFTSQELLNAFIKLFNDSLFLDPLLLAIFGAIGGAIRGRS